jgi:hypothetical protein
VAGPRPGCAAADALGGVLMAVRIAKQPPPDMPLPVCREALLACIGRNPGFMRDQPVGAGPAGTVLPPAWWQGLEDLFDEPDKDEVAA